MISAWVDDGDDDEEEEEEEDEDEELFLWHGWPTKGV